MKVGEKTGETKMGEPKMGESKTEKSKQTITRRDWLKMMGMGGIGLLLGYFGGSGLLAPSFKFAKSPGNTVPAQRTNGQVPFYGTHQAGISTPPQNFLCFAAFDVTTNKLSELASLFRAWTEAAAAMCSGKLVGTQNEHPHLPPSDTGEAAGLGPSRLTITFGVGPSLFDRRFGLASKRPPALADLPRFPGDNLQSEWCGGDIGVQVCADDLQVAFHAVRNLARIARGAAVLRWMQEGFQRLGTPGQINETPRNLLGFKDGTVNPDVNDKKVMNQVVWVQPSDGPAWMVHGTYMVVRRIRMHIEIWDRTTLSEQEATFGRYRKSGAPLGMKDEFDPLPLDAKNEKGEWVIPWNSHVRLAHGNGTEQILRRSYSYSSGMDTRTGKLDAGLVFICFQRDPRKQFIPIQQRLAANDKLNEYIVHVGSAVFACLPGTRAGGYIGETLFGS